MAATGTRAPYTVNQAVEVLVYDFAAPGQPLVWVRGTVTAVEPNGKLLNVSVTRDDCNGYAHQIVGPRCGNMRIRVAV